MTKKARPKIYPVTVPADPDEIRRMKFQNLAVAFGDCLDQLVEDGIRHLTSMALAPVKSTLLNEVRKAGQPRKVQK
jgi:hypothetical protein